MTFALNLDRNKFAGQVFVAQENGRHNLVKVGKYLFCQNSKLTSGGSHRCSRSRLLRGLQSWGQFKGEPASPLDVTALVTLD